jgi:hypothetical protein
LRLLSSLDRFYISERTQAKFRAQARPKLPVSQGKGTGFGDSDPFLPTSLSNGLLSFLAPYTPTSTSPQNDAKQRDAQLYSFFRGIAWILKNSSTEPGLLNLMRISMLGQAVEELVRNDSISDYSERAELYNAFIKALEVIASNPRLVKFYTCPRDEIESTDGVEHIISGQGKLVRARKNQAHGSDGTDGSAPPLVRLIENLAKQAETFYKTVTKVSVSPADKNVVDPINLCRRIIGLAQSLRSTAINAGHAEPIPQQLSGRDSYRLACSNLAYDEFPASASVPFAYTQLAQSTHSVNPRRTITLAKELSTMATSLPPGIFVRNIANRPDCIKVLIAGPEATPYYGALFEFDIFAPGNYPAEPPKVHLQTTANGQVRFNPNLYAYTPAG